MKPQQLAQFTDTQLRQLAKIMTSNNLREIHISRSELLAEMESRKSFLEVTYKPVKEGNGLPDRREQDD